MFVLTYCGEILCLLLLTFPASEQQTIDSSANRRNQFPTGQSDLLHPDRTSSDEQSELASHPSAALVIPTNYDEEDQRKSLQHSQLMRQVEDQLQDDDSRKYQDQKPKRQTDDLDGLIQKVFQPNSSQEHEYPDSVVSPYPKTELLEELREGEEGSVELKSNSVRNSPLKVVVFKGGLPVRDILKRKRLLRRLKSPLLRTSGHSSDSSSDEILHNILESIDQDNSEHGDPIKNAFLTKTTTYNISKLHGDGRNKSFLIEKIVNYTTNINVLHAENIPTNYSDSHSSVLQTILDLGKEEKTTRDFVQDEGNQEKLFEGSPDENELSNDIVGSQIGYQSDDNDGDNLKTPTQNNQQLPIEFVGGQYLTPQNLKSIDGSLQSDKKGNNHEFSDFVGGQFISPTKNKGDDLQKQKNSKIGFLDFVGGQFVEQPVVSKENPSETSVFDFETTETHDRVTHNPSFDVASRSLTKEDFDVKESKKQPNSNTFEAEKMEDHAVLQGDTSNEVNGKEKKSLGRNSGSGSRFENDYETTTFTVQDKAEVLQGKNRVSSFEFPIKKIQLTTAKPIFHDGYKKNMKAIGSVRKLIKSNIVTPDDLRFKTSNLDNENNIKEPFSTTTDNEDDTPQDNLSKTSDKPENFIKSLTSKEDKNFDQESDEEYTDTSREFVGLKPTNNYEGILRTDSASGTLVTVFDDYAKHYTTEANNLDDLEPLSTSGSTLQIINLSPNAPREIDHVDKASDFLQSSLQSYSINTEPPDQLGTDNEFEEENITSLVDEVKLYGGKVTASEQESEGHTTEIYESGISDVLNSSSETVTVDSKEKNATELCFTINNEKLPTLLELLSGKLYLEKDGKRTNLHLKGSPLKNCNSSNKSCKLFFDLKKSEPSISEEMFEVYNDNVIGKDIQLKSRNEKRHITAENSESTEPSETVSSSVEYRDKLTEREDVGKELLRGEIAPTAVNKSITDERELTLNKTELELPEPAGELAPEQALFVKLPVPYTKFDIVQNSSREPNASNDEIKVDGRVNEERITDGRVNEERITDGRVNDERITLHDLDSTYHSHGVPSPNPFLRKIHRKRDSHGHTGGACGCNNPLLLSPSPIPDFRHFVGKRYTILKNIVHTVKDWATQDALKA